MNISNNENDDSDKSVLSDWHRWSIDVSVDGNRIHPSVHFTGLNTVKIIRFKICMESFSAIIFNWQSRWRWPQPLVFRPKLFHRIDQMWLHRLKKFGTEQGPRTIRWKRRACVHQWPPTRIAFRWSRPLESFQKMMPDHFFRCSIETIE